MKRTTLPKLTEGRKALIKNVEIYNKHLKGTLSKFTNEQLLKKAHPLDRDDLKRNI